MISLFSSLACVSSHDTAVKLRTAALRSARSGQVHGVEATCAPERVGPHGNTDRSLDRSLIKRGGADTREGVIPLHITSFIEGLRWPSKWDGQRSSIPPDTNPPSRSSPAPLCSLRGKMTLSQGDTAPLRWREVATKEGAV